MISNRLLAVLEATGRLTGELRDHADAVGATVNIINGNAQPAAALADAEVATPLQARVVNLFAFTCSM